MHINPTLDKLHALNLMGMARALCEQQDRAQLRATIVTSQLPVAHWHEALGDPTLVDAILARLFENAVRLPLSGRSLRRHEDDAARDDAPSSEDLDDASEVTIVTTARIATR